MSLQPSGLLGDLWELSVVKLVEHSGVDGRHFLHGEVDVVEAVPESVEEQAGDAAGDGGGGGGLGQLGQVEPLAAQALLGAEVDVIGQGAQAADDVHIRHAEGTRVVVLLPDAQEGTEFGSHSSFLEHLTDCRCTL